MSTKANTAGRALRSPSYTVQRVDPVADRETVLGFLRASDISLSPQEYAWKYEHNPLGRACSWVAVEREHDKVVGHVALFPRRLFIAGTPHSGAVVGDFVVESAHRSFWPAFLLQRAVVSACGDGCEFLYTFPNPLARLILIRAGYRSIGSFQTGIRLLRTRAALKKKYPFLAFPGVCSTVDLALRCVSKESWHNSRGVHAEVLHEFDERFEPLWGAVSSRGWNRVERGLPYANWRFASAAQKKFSIHAVSRSGTDPIAGYIVWSADDRDPERVAIFDFLAFDEAIDSLLASFISRQRQRNIHSIKLTYFGIPALVRRFQQFGFLFRRAADEVVVVAAPSLAANPRTFDATSWYLVEGDSDV